MGYRTTHGDGTEKNEKEGLRVIRLSAIQGESDAQNVLAKCLIKGIVEKGKETEGYEWFEKSSQSGNAEATNFLGYCTVHGIGRTNNPEEAVKYYQAAAEQGYPSANGKRLHRRDLRTTDFEKAHAYYLQAATAGEIDAQAILGNNYINEKGVERNIEEGLRWTQLAAEQNQPVALGTLGACYETGTGMPHDMQKAVELYHKNAELGNSMGMSNLATCFLYGKGVQKDYEQAFLWSQQGANLGDPNSAIIQACCYLEGMGIPKDIDKALHIIQQEIKKNNPHAFSMMGNLYLKGIGRPKSETEALKYYRLAAERNDAESLQQLETMYAEGYGGLEKNETEAFRYYERATNLGNSEGQYRTAIAYLEGKMVQPDTMAVVEYTLQSAHQEHEEAVNLMGYLNQYGIGMPVNLEYAHNWYQHAVELGSAQGACNLGLLYYQSTEAEKLADEILQLIQTAAVADIPAAKGLLGKFQLEGWHMEKNIEEGFLNLQKGANSGTMLQFKMGECYEYGIGVEKNLDEAIRWYQIAAQQGLQAAIDKVEELQKN